MASIIWKLLIIEFNWYNKFLKFNSLQITKDKDTKI